MEMTEAEGRGLSEACGVADRSERWDKATSSASDWCWHGVYSGYYSVVSYFYFFSGLHYFIITSGMKGQDAFNDLSYLYAICTRHRQMCTR